MGNGPSALILSFILHGNIPYYNPSNPHPDPILNSKLSDAPCLLEVDVAALTAHFSASRLSYSTQALPINVLFDTLIRPLADTEPGTPRSCVEWRFEPERVVDHIVLGNTAQAGGQWADNPVSASWDIGTLSYAEMLSLPGYSIEDHHKAFRLPEFAEFHRPTRRQVASYLAAYPAAVGIADSFLSSTTVGNVTRTNDGFYLGSHNMTCKHLVLGSGIFSQLLPARLQLQPLIDLPDHSSDLSPPLLVVGSGFTAADIIISTLPTRKIIHIFKWAPEDRPSPLRACHPQAYPEYAGVYRRMKEAAMKMLGDSELLSPTRRRKSNPFFDPKDWEHLYEGFPNTLIQEISVHDGLATVSLQGSDGKSYEREISNLEYVIGRRGSLDYLEHGLRKEALGTDLTKDQKVSISGQSLRSKVENNLEVAPNVFVIGSLTGDSLIRFAFGGCVFAAHEIMARNPRVMPCHQARLCLVSETKSRNEQSLTNGHATRTIKKKSPYDDYYSSNGHSDLGIHRKARAKSIELEVMSTDMWRRSGWWSGGCVIS